MLKHLHIKNFTIIQETAVDFNSGLTVLTGETGAGKSILIDALQLLLGGRAENMLIKSNEERCEISAIFDIKNNGAAQAWLKNQDMDEDQTCFIRRVISREGPSRSSINGRPCTLQFVRELGDLLIHIHGQNQHQQLLKNEYQRELLDDYAQHVGLCQKVHTIYHQWQKTRDELVAIEIGNSSNQKDFLAFQLSELEELNLEVGELEKLEAEHRQLSGAEQWIANYEQALQVLTENDQSVLYGLDKVSALLKNIPNSHAPTEELPAELLQQATIQVQEAAAQLRHTLKTFEPNPERLQWIEQRMARIHHMARKHKISPEELLALQQNLSAQYHALDQSTEQSALLKQQMSALADEYRLHAQKLTESRQKAAQKFSKAISTHIQTLGMPTGRVEIQLLPKEKNEVSLNGNERIELLVNTNPGQALAPLNKVVSGGELSRIALAIQVVAAQTAILPTLVFDEVDVGIGGGIAETVGLQLKNLGERTQVLCVTHLPQVAALGHQHLRVQKNVGNKAVKTEIHLLSLEEKIQEVARMLGGVKLTEKTLEHAKEMVRNAAVV